MDIDVYKPAQLSFASPHNRKRARSLSPEPSVVRHSKRTNRIVLARVHATTPLSGYSPAHSPRDSLSSQTEGLNLATPRDSPPQLLVEEPKMYMDSGGWQTHSQESDLATSQDDPMSQDGVAAPEERHQGRSLTLQRSTSLPRSMSMPPSPSSGRRCQRFTLGYRHDCEKCRLHVPGHYAHVL